MNQEKKSTNHSDDILSWEVREYEKHNRRKSWYIIAIATTFLLLLYSFFTSNFLFAVIIIIVSLIVIMNDGHIPETVKISLTDEGIIVGRKFYDYDEIKNFTIIYKPRLEVKNLYFEFKNVFRHRLSISLEKMNPIAIRENLLKYLPENHDRINPPLSEGLANFFKL